MGAVFVFPSDPCLSSVVTRKSLKKFDGPIH